MPQVHRRNLRAYGQTHRLDTWAVASIEIPHEVQKGKERPVELLCTSCCQVRPRAIQYAAHDHPGDTGESRCIEPDDQVGTGQAKIEGTPGAPSVPDWERGAYTVAIITCRPSLLTIVAGAQCSLRRWALLENSLA